jgi:probable addiction module antidote protein
MTIETIPFEPEAYFKTEDSQARLVSNALDSRDPQFLIDAIGVVARARGIAKVADETGLTRQALYAAFGPKGNPTMSTVMKVLNCLGLQLELRKAA